MFIALEGSGTIPTPDEDLSEALLMTTMAEKFGWSFVKDALNIGELDVIQFAHIKGIIKGELKKQRMDKLRSKLK